MCLVPSLRTWGGVGYTQTLKTSKQDIIYQDQGFQRKEE